MNGHSAIEPISLQAGHTEIRQHQSWNEVATFTIRSKGKVYPVGVILLLRIIQVARCANKLRMLAVLATYQNSPLIYDTRKPHNP